MAKELEKEARIAKDFQDVEDKLRKRMLDRDFKSEKIVKKLSKDFSNGFKLI